VGGSHEASQRLLVPACCSSELSSQLKSTYLALLAAVIEPLRNESYDGNEERLVHQPPGDKFDYSHRGMLAGKKTVQLASVNESVISSGQNTH
jgi:hypothetical protein